MKFSEKALRLIGLTVLESMHSKKIQDDSKHLPDSASAGGYGRPRLTIDARLKASKAPVIPFHKKKAAS